MDILYLVMVAVFLIACVLLLFWNRGREKRMEQMGDSGVVTLEKSRLSTRRPKIKKRSNIETTVGNKVQGKMWYYSIDGNSKQGPVSEEELSQLLSSRRLLPDTLVWTQELPYWKKASSFENLMISQ
jgi:hypothetical protein